MASVNIVKVEAGDKLGLETFIQFHYDLYRGDPYDVPNLHLDEVGTLTREKNPAFDFCDAEYYLAYKDGKVAGRVAAIINWRANERWHQKRVRFGWIDFIDDEEVSSALLGAVEDYGRRQGMREVVGPLGFTDMDPEGMLTWGFDQLGTQATIYNYDYYPRHIEQMGGWDKDMDYVEFKIMVPERIPEKYAKISQMIEKRYNLHVKKLTRKEINAGYGRKIFEVINTTFKDLYGYSELTDRQIDHYVKMYLPMADLNLVTLVEDWNAGRKVVGVGITIPSLSRALQKCRNGRLWPTGWWHVIRALRFQKTEGVDLLLLGVLPEYRKKGANALMFSDLIPWYQRYGFKWAESQVELESNENVQSQWQYLETVNHKRRRCYVKQIKENGRAEG